MNGNMTQWVLTFDQPRGSFHDGSIVSKNINILNTKKGWDHFNNNCCTTWDPNRLLRRRIAYPFGYAAGRWGHCSSNPFITEGNWYIFLKTLNSEREIVPGRSLSIREIDGSVIVSKSIRSSCSKFWQWRYSKNFAIMRRYVRKEIPKWTRHLVPEIGRVVWSFL